MDDQHLARRIGAVVGFAALVFFLPLRARLHAPGQLMEEGFVLSYARQWAHGATVYTDMEWFYGPLGVWLPGTAFRVLGGASLLVERCIGVGYQLALVIGLAVFASRYRRLAGFTAPLLATILVVVGVAPDGLPITAGLACVVWALVAVQEGLRCDSNRCMVAAGVLFGLALGFRPDLLVAVALAAYPLLRPPGTQRKALAQGFVVGLLPLLLAFALAPEGMVNNLLRDAVRIPGERALPIPSPSTSTGRFLAVSVLCLAVSAIVIVVHRRRAPGRRSDDPLVAMLLFGVGISYEVAQRADNQHIAYAAVIVIPLLPIALAATRSERHWYLPAVAGALLMGVLAVAAPYQSLATYGSLTARSVGLRPPVPHTTVRSGGAEFIYPPGYARSVAVLIDAVKEVGRPGQRLVVVTDDLAGTGYVDSSIYHLLPQFRVGTRFLDMHPGVGERRRSELVQAIDTADMVVTVDISPNREPRDAVFPRDGFCFRRRVRTLALFSRCST